ncbi:MAG TPA: ABC transporter permease [Candidatus Brocadiia bacterium]|nr:ABC transporter permease [Candidatus Brocadiia bacterium]
MLIWTIIKVALRSLCANKLRSFLAMLGIIIGVAAVISMLALGSGARKQVLDRMTAMGMNLLIVRPGAATRGGVRSSASYRSLRVEDAEAILAKVPGVEAVAPQVKYFNHNTNTTIAGSTLTYLSLRNFELDKGRGFSSEEENRAARLAILGAKAAEDLFGEQNPVDSVIKIKGINFRVLGVLKAKGDQGWFNPDDMVVIPYLTAMRQVFGQIHLSEIDLKARDGADLIGMEAAVTQLLRKRHRLRPEADNDFHVRNQAELIETASSIIQTFTILLGGIAGISLVVGGIGIMNIMLVTVTERTREIGVRKAIGARDRDILRQFLIESVLISGLGGALGIAAGFGVAAAVERYSEYTTIVEPYSVILSLAVSASVGIFFGFYPAYRAACLDPIEALRYE